MTRRAKTLVLLSGGPDSAALLAWALRRGPVATLEVDYPGRPAGERRASAALRRHYGVREHYRAAFPSVDGRSTVRSRHGSGYVPLRNLLLQANAAFVARMCGARVIAAGHVRTDGSAFRDAKAAFLSRLGRLLNAARQSGESPLRVVTPFLHLSKHEVARRALRWGVPLHRSWSCFRDGNAPCGRCTSCRERHAALKALIATVGGPARARRAQA